MSWDTLPTQIFSFSSFFIPTKVVHRQDREAENLDMGNELGYIAYPDQEQLERVGKSGIPENGYCTSVCMCVCV